MPNPTVNTLKKNQVAVLLGHKIFPRDSPRFEIKRVGENNGNIEYEMIVTVKMIVRDENLTSTPKPLPSDNSFAVLNKREDPVDPAKSEIYITTVQNGGSDDFDLNLSMNLVVPGSKGKLGN
jgi:hypothetical protein